MLYPTSLKCGCEIDNIGDLYTQHLAVTIRGPKCTYKHISEDKRTYTDPEQDRIQRENDQKTALERDIQLCKRLGMTLERLQSIRNM